MYIVETCSHQSSLVPLQSVIEQVDLRFTAMHCFQQCKITGCFLRPDIKRFCLIFTIGPDRIWFCLIQVPDFFLQ